MLVDDNGHDVFTTGEVARFLHVHVNTVRRWSNEGILRTYRIGPRGDRRYTREAIDKFLGELNRNVVRHPSDGNEYPSLLFD